MDIRSEHRRARFARFRGVAAAAMLALAASPAGAADPDPLVARVVAAYGGAEAIGAVTRFRVEARVVAHIRGVEGTVRRDLVPVDRLRAWIRYPDRTEVRIVNADRVWRGDAHGVQPVQGPPAAAIRYQFLRLAVPWVFRNLADRLQSLGTRRWKGRPYAGFALPWSDDLHVVYWVEPGSGRVERVDGILRAGAGGLRFGAAYGDFRRVNGVLFPFQEEVYARARHTGTTTVERVIVDPPDMGPFEPDTPDTPAAPDGEAV